MTEEGTGAVENVSETQSAEDTEQKVSSWDNMGLDQRILAGITSLGWKEPSEIQEAAIPIALKGKSIVAKAKTGSGKTGAFCLPIIQRILCSPASRSIIVCPTRDLCSQTHKFLSALASRCSDIISLHELGSEKDSVEVIGASIIIGTPGRLAKAVKANRLEMKQVAVVVFDEADLLFGFGQESVVKEFIQYLPGHQQTFLMSATLTEHVDMIKKLTIKKHVLLKLADSLPPQKVLQQYQICLNGDFDKFLVILSLLKLKIIRGKSLIFVDGTNRTYKLKLFLKQFSVSSVILSSELDAKSRQNAVLQFNKGRYDTLIANDRADIDEAAVDEKEKKKTKKEKMDAKEFGLSRGIDFQNVSNVINFDQPCSEKQYVHRAGRTARCGSNGRVINLMIGPEQRQFLKKIAEKHSFELLPFKFKMDEVDGLRMRAKEAHSLCSKNAIRSMRMGEIKQALLNSEKLQEEYFTINENDLLALRHDAKMTKISQQNMSVLPDYLIPKQIRKNKFDPSTVAKRKNHWKLSKAEMLKKKAKRKANDPLNSVKSAKKVKMEK